MLIRRITTGSPEYPGLLRLREEVLCRPIGITLQDVHPELDPSATILVAVESDGLIGCVMLQPKADGTVQLRQMAVHPHWQGKGIGQGLVAAAEETAWAEGYTRIVLHAREVVAPFYEKLGYREHGDRFTEVGIPHLLMQKEKY